MIASWVAPTFVANNRMRSILVPETKWNQTQTAIPSIARARILVGSSSGSPPLSDIEIEDLIESRREFEGDQQHIFVGADELVKALIISREEFIRSKRE